MVAGGLQCTKTANLVLRFGTTWHTGWQRERSPEVRTWVRQNPPVRQCEQSLGEPFCRAV